MEISTITYHLPTTTLIPLSLASRYVELTPVNSCSEHVKLELQLAATLHKMRIHFLHYSICLPCIIILYYYIDKKKHGVLHTNGR